MQDIAIAWISHIRGMVNVTHVMEGRLVDIHLFKPHQSTPSLFGLNVTTKKNQTNFMKMLFALHISRV